MHTTNESKPSSTLQDTLAELGNQRIEQFVWYLMWFLLSIRRFKIYGIDNIPKVGGVLVVINHQALLDPFIVKYAIMKSQPGRLIYAMGKEELFHNSVISAILVGMRVFPVNRNHPLPSTFKISKRILEARNILGMFPQGTRGGKEINPGAWALTGSDKHPDQYPISVVTISYNQHWFTWLSDIVVTVDPVVSRSEFGLRKSGEDAFAKFLKKRWDN